MKYIIIGLLLVINTVSCQTKTTANMAELIPTQQVAKEKQYIYGLDLTSYQPYEIYINNILIAYDASGGGELIDLRPWLLHNGKYTITLKFLTFKDDAFIDFSLTGYLRFTKFLEDNEGYLDKKTMVEQSLPIYFPEEKVPYYEQKWKIEITDLPYELEGWQNGQDLSKWNKDVLLKKVVNHYEKLRNILNKGDSATWMDLTKIRTKETYVLDYFYDEEKIREKFKKNSRKIREYAKGNMVPIENYAMKIYGENNQLVSLERIDTENIGEGVLRTLEPDGAIRIYNLKLYLSKDSNEFVIIRK